MVGRVWPRHGRHDSPLNTIVRCLPSAVPRQRSLESRISEHTRFRRQCQIRIKPSLQLTLLAVLVAGVVLLYQPQSWLFAVAIVAFPALFTSLEVWGYLRHDRALRKLADAEDI
jgi:hypothetical protein